MTFIQFYYDPITEFDHLFEDALAGAKHTTSRHRNVYRPR